MKQQPVIIPKKGNDNPFFGCRKMLNLLQAADKPINPILLDEAYNEAKSKGKEAMQVFYSILFSVGDITNRQHNIFHKQKVDDGGFANREAFYGITKWLWQKSPAQFQKFLDARLFNEFNCFDTLLRNRVQTKGKNVVQVFDAFIDPVYFEAMLNFCYKVVKGTNVFDKMLLAKFLTIPRTSKRQGHKKMLDQTKSIMIHKREFIIKLSEMLGWETTNLKGYREWRKDYNGTLESVLFTTGKIKELKKEEFLDWFNKLPAQARFRVKNRILYSKKTIEHTDGTKQEVEKWTKLQPWLKEWEQLKEKAQMEERILKEKVRQGTASEEDKTRLKKVEKEAKVTTGANNFQNLYDSILNGSIDWLKMETFLNKVNMEFNALVIIDDSGSMSGEPFNFAKFMAAICLAKNPDDEGRNLIGMFNTDARLYAYIDKKTEDTGNYFMRARATSIKRQPFIDPHKSFKENYMRISSFLNAEFQGGGTYINRIPECFHRIAQRDPEMLDALKNYPIWIVISDGMWNYMPSPESTVGYMLEECEKFLGFRPYIVAMDITRGHNLDANKFAGIENIIYIPSNPAMIQQVLCNFKNMDTYDVYTPLLSLFRSNRYQLVRDNVL